MSLEMSFVQLRIPDMIRLNFGKLGSLGLNLIQYEKSLLILQNPI